MPFITSSREEAVTTITLNRPDKLNAFSGTMREDLLAALHDAEEGGSCRAVILTGAGRAFCAGGDVEAMSALQRDRNAEAFQKLLDTGAAIVTQITSMTKPVIAAINGVAAGAGCNLALACDYRIASDTAKLGESFVRIGLHPDWGGTWLLPRIIGRSRAVELLMTGRLVDAVEALALGMVDRVVSSGELPGAATELARAMAAGPPLAIGGIKRALLASERNDLPAQLDLEAENQIKAFLSADSSEGMAAYFEKRPPRFRGK